MYNRNLSNRQRLFSVRRGTGFPFGLAVFGIIFLVIGLAVAGILVERATLKTVTFTVQDKAVTVQTDGKTVDHTYMIYTDHGVYKDEDSLAFFKFNSADVYGQLQKGHTYTCRVTGFRIPVLSSFNNIIDCKEVSK